VKRAEQLKTAPIDRDRDRADPRYRARSPDLVPIFVPTRANRRAKAAVAQLGELIYGIIEERWRTGDTGDLLSMLIAATEEDDGKLATMTEVQLRDEAMTLMLAGHETTSLTLSYTLDLLARHPAAFDWLASEIDAVLAGRLSHIAKFPVRASLPASGSAPVRIGGR
jgi:cytochrome P450